MVKTVGNIESLYLTPDGQQIITIKTTTNFKPFYDDYYGKLVSVVFEEYKETRSLNANSYFHVLVHKIAEKQGLGNDEVKIWLNLEYGTPDNTDGKMTGVKIPSNVDASKIYPYFKEFDTRTENGVEFTCYIAYKRTRNLNTKEMARLIDGTVYEAKNLGIQVLSDSELDLLKREWKQ